MKKELIDELASLAPYIQTKYIGVVFSWEMAPLHSTKSYKMSTIIEEGSSSIITVWSFKSFILHHNQYHSSSIVSVMKGWESAYLALRRALGSIFKHLLRKSIKCLLFDLILDLRLVIFGVKIRQKPVFLFLRFPYTYYPIYSQIYSKSTSYLVKYLEISLPVSIIQEGQGPLSPCILASIPTILSL